MLADLIEAVCKRLEPHALKEGGDPGKNKWGIVVEYHQKQVGVIAFIFETYDGSKVTMTIDTKRQKFFDIMRMCDDVADGLVAKQRERNLRALPVFVGHGQPAIERPH